MDLAQEREALQRAASEQAERARVQAERLAALPVPARKSQRSAAASRRDHRELVTKIWAAHDAGCANVDIADATRLTRERIRQLCEPGYREHALARFEREAVS
jgi:hypothetical protein